MAKREARSRRNKPHSPNEATELDGDFSFPHVPMHVHMSSREDTTEDMAEGTSVCSPGLGRDKYNIALLMFLYVLQGIPLGLAGSVPYLLSSRHVSYKDQAIFSFVYWPFSVKLLWAPIVDSVYLPAFGRRKSWLVPTQYLIGVFMFVLSLYITELMGDDDPTAPVSVTFLTVVFFALNFLAATQDIAVDGWALTMLSRGNVGWASTCNSVGQTAGYFLGNVVFLALESAEFCNSYLREEPAQFGVVTFAGFLWFWGIVFFVTTTFVMIFKRENDGNGSSADEPESDQGIVETYQTLWKIIKLPAVKTLIFILLTVKIGFGAADNVTGLKLIEEGVPKEKLALLGVPIVPIQIILPLIISKYTTGPRPMDIYIKAMPYRLVLGLGFMALVWWAPSTKTSEGEYPFYFYCVILAIYAVHQVTLYSMFVAQMSFYAQISDPLIGGTYMTLLNTVTNLGGNWPGTVSLWLVDSLTWKQCEGAEGFCDTPTLTDACQAAGGECVTTLDGYYIESAACFILGVLWILWKAGTLRKLQALGPRAWTCN